MEQILNFKIEIPDEFKNEIISGVVTQIKDLMLNNKAENQNDLLSRAETANLLKISLVKLWQLTKDKVIPVYKIGNKVLYKRSEVEQLFNSNLL
ncbi:DNA binding domain protein, putative excisionase family protein [Flavobacterium indicum GPTSA100-9 = DSM 17447]|jgi:excisionase family DNA binding protein|uniref:DNA binding domain protein, putative excisionase family protein n=1 Tax=Flavobacterium indicum (strain DSM 17447 / CIP 109464 / GPTSA100-9) TaxID=1094466 RepID=H8XNS0_FLAIG|nr:helix-turn-helix domain-containing protein [Flavobacterium indicum]CCG52187.1 DNA binding domain protein, putative excisionase family protein [Flavobacterium indicum GPTSA100-9 = DSM 17447]